MTEHDHQVALFHWASLAAGNYPELRRMYAIPNGGMRHRVVAAKLKAEGVKAGVPDVCLPVPRGGYHGLYIEMKKPGGKVSNSQKQWINWLQADGHLAVVCFGFEEAREILLDYLQGVISA